MIQFVKLKDKDYPVVYSAPAMRWWANKIGIKMSEVEDAFANLDTGGGYELFALLYSGVVAGCEAKSKRLDISFFEFQELVANDVELVEALGTLFQRHMEVIIKEAESSAKKKPKQSRSTSTKST